MSKNEAKRIVITGVSQGLGYAMTVGFLELGHHVYGCARTPSKIEIMNRELSGSAKKYAGNGKFAVVNVCDDTRVAAWATEVLAEGPIDYLINNAALMNAPAPLWEVPANEFDAMIDVNLKGIANTIRHFVPSMVEQNLGIIINFSSGWGRSVDPEVAPYCATKWGVEGLTRALAHSLSHNMAAIPLNPGIINTEMLHRCFGEDAVGFPLAEDWAKRAVPFILKLSANENGEALTVM